MNQENNLDNLVKILKALANPTRLKILALCTEKPMTSKELREKLKISKPLLIAHLKILIKTGLLQYEIEIDQTKGILRKKYKTTQINICINNQTLKTITQQNKQ